MDTQNQNSQVLALANREVWQNFKLAVAFTSALVNLYALILILVISNL